MYVFPNERSRTRAMSDNGIRFALRTLGYTNDDMIPHGFRAMARTLLDEELSRFRPDWIEQQLHIVCPTRWAEPTTALRSSMSERK